MVGNMLGKHRHLSPTRVFLVESHGGLPACALSHSPSRLDSNNCTAATLHSNLIVCNGSPVALRHRLVHAGPLRGEGGYGVRVSGNQQFEFTQLDGRVIESVPKNSAESFRDTDIETLNREHGLDIDAETCVFPGNGARLDHAMAVEELLHCDGALHLDPATGHYPAHFPPARE